MSLSRMSIGRFPTALLCVAVCCSVLQCVAVCCSMLQEVTNATIFIQKVFYVSFTNVHGKVPQCVASFL